MREEKKTKSIQVTCYDGEEKQVNYSTLLTKKNVITRKTTSLFHPTYMLSSITQFNQTIQGKSRSVLLHWNLNCYLPLRMNTSFWDQIYLGHFLFLEYCTLFTLDSQEQQMTQIFLICSVVWALPQELTIFQKATFSKFDFLCKNQIFHEKSNCPNKPWLFVYINIPNCFLVVIHSVK